MYTPTDKAQQYLKEAQTHDVAMGLPQHLMLTKCKLDDFTGEVGEKVKCDFSNESLKCNGDKLSLQQRQFLMGRYLVDIQGMSVFVNTSQLHDDLEGKASKQPRKKSVSMQQPVDEE